MIIGKVELTIPAREDMLLIIRMALSGVCARCGFSMGMVEDARIAADEACYCLMHQHASAESLRLRCFAEGSRLVVSFDAIRRESVERAVENDPHINETPDAILARAILESLVSSARLSSDSFGVYAIRMEMEHNSTKGVTPRDG